MVRPWTPHHPSVHKLNFAEVRFQSSSDGCVGMVVCNHEGQLLTAICERLQQIPSG
ncbi:hypothetical protein FCV25MIE_16922, partial [Fagus crenata]